ncbi:hypothetical protein JNUCC0626_48420 [Lentzea sp. JNUCC 0626]|uniref:hypothetical protein n=1 Tax=Lentzea sp. JNUCC 0626 TaxID=3367513 RepID=UPI003748E1F9
MIFTRVARSVTVAVLASAAVMAGTTAAQARPTNHFILFANKSFVMNICATARDGSGAEVGKKCGTRAAGKNLVYWVPNHATSTRFTITDRGTQMLGVDLANNRDYCYRAAASDHGKVTGPHTPCTPD